MLRFPEDRVFRRRRFGLRRSFSVLLVIGLFVAWYLVDQGTTSESVTVKGQKIIIADGDSFAIGTYKLRLQGIDAPEYRQTCTDAAGGEWPCGRTARAALEKLLTEPGLACEAGARDRYARSLATCRTARTADVAAAQVSDGMAVSDEYYGSRSYGDQEDAARAAKRGIWQGSFMLPSEWRATKGGGTVSDAGT